MSSSGKSWAGEQELQQALKELNNVHPPPASKVKHAVSVALKFPNDFKMSVFDIEKWMKKSSIKDRIAGIFVIDSICRGSRALHKDKSKDLFSARFATRLNEIFLLMNGVPDQDIVTLQRVVDEWIRWDIFSIDKLQQALKGVKSPSIRPLTPANTTAGPDSFTALNDSKTSSPTKTSRSDENSSTLIANRPSKMEITREILIKQIGKRKSTKYCPYRDSNCPYGDKCRFSHADVKLYLPTAIKRPRREGVLEYRSAENLLPDSLASNILSIDDTREYFGNPSSKLHQQFHFHHRIQRLELDTNKTVIEFCGTSTLSNPTITSQVSVAMVHEDDFKRIL